MLLPIVMLATKPSAIGALVATLVLGVALLLIVAMVFHPRIRTLLDRLMPEQMPLPSAHDPVLDKPPIRAEHSGSREDDSGDAVLTLGRDLVRRVFRTVLSRVLCAVFILCFTVRFFEVADLGRRYDRQIWEATRAGVWSASIAVLIVLVVVVLWRLAHSERLR